MFIQNNNPFKKRMGEFKESDAPDAKGKFKSLSPSGLASWLIKSRGGNLSKIISSLNQQVVFNRRKNPGSKLKTAVTTPPSKLKPGSKAAKRRKSFCARSRGWTSERGKAARRRWRC